MNHGKGPARNARVAAAAPGAAVQGRSASRQRRRFPGEHAAGLRLRAGSGAVLGRDGHPAVRRRRPVRHPRRAPRTDDTRRRRPSPDAGERACGRGCRRASALRRRPSRDRPAAARGLRRVAGRAPRRRRVRRTQARKPQASRARGLCPAHVRRAGRRRRPLCADFLRRHRDHARPCRDGHPDRLGDRRVRPGPARPAAGTAARFRLL